MKQKLTLTLALIMALSASAVSEDHSEYIEGPFDTPQEVTETCLTCHEEAGEAFLHSVHWTWLGKESEVPGYPGKVRLGKKSVLNNFCIGLESNWPRCTSCHAGYGWEDDSFDFENMSNMDCLVCHDNTGTYKKSPAGAGYPADGVDLEKVAKSVGPTTRESCGSCHYFGGGGNNVKHGDLDVALNNAPHSLDVHMSPEGQDFTCTACHTAENHIIPGNALSVSVHDDGLVTCENCHTNEPHSSRTLNTHAKTVACQTCHIPEYARANPTKLNWDWSTAGQDLPVQKDENGMPTYSKMKGTFVWGKNVKPEYAWYNGNSDHMILGEKIDLDGVVTISKPLGSKDDDKAKIYPFKVHRGKQAADKNYAYLLPTHLYGGYWKHFDWNEALKVGSEKAGIDYSGEYVFVKTEMYWKINHMVAPKEKALQCYDCHGPNQTRMDWKAIGYTKGDPRKYGGGRYSLRK